MKHSVGYLYSSICLYCRAMLGQGHFKCPWLGRDRDAGRGRETGEKWGEREEERETTERKKERGREEDTQRRALAQGRGSWRHMGGVGGEVERRRDRESKAVKKLHPRFARVSGTTVPWGGSFRAWPLKMRS